MPTDVRDAPRALIVDDEPLLVRAHARILSNNGFAVETAADGAAAMAAVEKAPFDVILSDIDMPGMDGIRLLEGVRRHDVDVPVILITGAPSVRTAIDALELGALRYLIKPVATDVLVKVTKDAVRLHRLAKAKRAALDLMGSPERVSGDRAALTATFDRALEALHMHYQPIVSWSQRSVYAYEALVRSGELAMAHPMAILDAAERLGRVHDLGRRVRALSARAIERIGEGVSLFVNLHPRDLLDDELFSSNGPLARVAGSVVLEMTERAALDDIRDVRARVAQLRRLGYRVAVDDLGAGYAGLTSFALLEPDVVKLDMALIRNLHREPTKQKLVRTMITMCKEMGIVVTAEGIEEPEEREAILEAGCDLLQGYLFARPGPAYPAVLY